MDGNPDQSGRIRNPVYIDLTSPPPSPRLAFPRISPFSIGGSAERPIDVDLPSTTPTPPPPIAERLLDVDLPSSTSAPPLTSTQPPVISTSSGSVESSITNPIPATAAVIDSQYPTSVALVSETMRSDSRRSASRVSNATSTTRGGNSPSPSVARAASASKSRRPHLVREAKVGSIANMLQNYITDMKRDQVYIVKNCLAAARHVMNKVPVYRGAESPGRPGILYDEVSPFKDMEALDVSQPTGPDTIRLTAVHYPKTHTSSQHKLFLTPKFAETPKHLPEIPKYRHYITLRANLVAENEENLRYYPYFGEEDAESEAARQLRLEELFIDQTKKSSEVNQRLECITVCLVLLKMVI
ncbi:hypothetical protein EDC01DRAFT_478286 [Geopyxis carbonaria]|nr:hypothetical protein EDC01DRAFT_478286 [Geopyxis carbonaria]